MKKNETEVINYINGLKGYQGYIQMSDNAIKDIWHNFSDINFTPKSGFVYEAHFFNGKDSIAIRQINNEWIVDEVENVPMDNVQVFEGKHNIKVKMAQVWEETKDELCENMPVQKLKKVVFAGFEGGKK